MQMARRNKKNDRKFTFSLSFFRWLLSASTSFPF